VNDTVVLDSGPLGMLCNPNSSRHPTAIRAWVADLMKAGRRVILPEIADYEIRRELNRIQSHRALMLLNMYGIRLEYLALTTTAMRLAADLWAQARNAGQQTAADLALDCDVILAAQTLTPRSPSYYRHDEHRTSLPFHTGRVVAEHHSMTPSQDSSNQRTAATGSGVAAARIQPTFAHAACFFLRATGWCFQRRCSQKYCSGCRRISRSKAEV